jgi:hypothetical protein
MQTVRATAIDVAARCESTIQRHLRLTRCILGCVGGLLGGRRLLGGGAGFVRKPIRLTSLRISSAACAFRNRAQAGDIALCLAARNEIRVGGGMIQVG